LRVSSESARAREEAPKLPRWIAQNAAPWYLFPARETIQPPLEEDTARARGKKSVILALRYFSAAAGDALMLLFTSAGSEQHRKMFLSIGFPRNSLIRKFLIINTVIRKM
jgi:hypothetical protein